MVVQSRLVLHSNKLIESHSRRGGPYGPLFFFVGRHFSILTRVTPNTVIFTRTRLRFLLGANAIVIMVFWFVCSTSWQESGVVKTMTTNEPITKVVNPSFSSPVEYRTEESRIPTQPSIVQPHAKNSQQEDMPQRVGPSTPEPIQPLFYQIDESKLSQLPIEQQFDYARIRTEYTDFIQEWSTSPVKDVKAWNRKMRELQLESSQLFGDTLESIRVIPQP